MAAQGHNQGFHVLDEFVCDAIPEPSIPLATPLNQGRNEGMSVVEELLLEAGNAPPSEGPDGRQSPGTAVTEEALKSEAQRLAAMIAASADPVGTATRFQKLLLAELAGDEFNPPDPNPQEQLGIRLAQLRDRLRDVSQRPESRGE
jgi:hypothetical protein